MSEATQLATPAATAALQVVIELIRAGELKTGLEGKDADAIIRAHTQLTAHFETFKKPAMNINLPRT